MLTHRKSWTVASQSIRSSGEQISSSARCETGCPVCLSSVMMRAAALPEVASKLPTGKPGDFGLYLRIAVDADVGFPATPGVELRVHRGQLSNVFDTADRAMKVGGLPTSDSSRRTRLAWDAVEPLRRAAPVATPRRS